MANNFLELLRQRADTAKQNADEYVNVANTGYYPGEEPAETEKDPNAPGLADQLRNWSNNAIPSENSAQASEAVPSPMAAPNVGPKQPQLVGPVKPESEETEEEPNAAMQANRGKSLVSFAKQGLGTTTQDKSAGGGQPTSSVDDILAKLNGNDEELNRAKDTRNQLQLFSMLGQAGNQILGGATGSKVDNSVFDQMGKLAGQGIDDIKTKSALNKEKLAQHEAATKLKNDIAKSDPTSPISAEYRQAIKEMTGKDVNENISAGDLDKMSGIYEKMWATRENAKMRAEAAAERSKKSGDDKILKYSKSMGEDLDPNRPRTGEFGKNQSRVNAAERIEGLYNAVGGDPNAINMRELATSVATMLSTGSQTAVTQINELVPHTMSGNAAKMQEWLTSNPHGAGQQKFAEMYLHIAQREKEIAQKQMLEAQFKKANSTHHKYKELDEDGWYTNLATATGMPVDEIKAMEKQPGFNGQYKEKDGSKEGSATEVERKTKDGKIAIFDAKTKKFLRYK